MQPVGNLAEMQEGILMFALLSFGLNTRDSLHASWPWDKGKVQSCHGPISSRQCNYQLKAWLSLTKFPQQESGSGMPTLPYTETHSKCSHWHKKWVATHFRVTWSFLPQKRLCKHLQVFKILRLPCFYLPSGLSWGFMSDGAEFSSFSPQGWGHWVIHRVQTQTLSLNLTLKLGSFVVSRYSVGRSCRRKRENLAVGGLKWPWRTSLHWKFVNIEGVERKENVRQ